MRRVFLILSFLLVLSTCKKEDDPTVVVNASVADSSMGSIDFKAGSYTVGASVTFSATPQAGYTFVSWTDSSTNQTYSNNPLTLNPDQNTTLVANFEKTAYNININVTGNGEVQKQVVGGGTSFTHGATVELTAVPADQYSFFYWDNDPSDTTNPKSITLDGNKDVSAKFDYEVAKNLVGDWEFEIGGDSSSRNVTVIRMSVDIRLNVLMTTIVNGVVISQIYSQIIPISSTAIVIGDFAVMTDVVVASPTSLSMSMVTLPENTLAPTKESEIPDNAISLNLSGKKSEEASQKDESGIIIPPTQATTSSSTTEDIGSVFADSINQITQSQISTVASETGTTSNTTGTTTSTESSNFCSNHAEKIWADQENSGVKFSYIMFLENTLTLGDKIAIEYEQNNNEDDECDIKKIGDNFEEISNGCSINAFIEIVENSSNYFRIKLTEIYCNNSIPPSTGYMSFTVNNNIMTRTYENNGVIEESKTYNVFNGNLNTNCFDLTSTTGAATSTTGTTNSNTGTTTASGGGGNTGTTPPTGGGGNNSGTTTPTDITPPIITLNGQSSISLSVGDSYTEQGATANDNVDGNLTNNIVINGSVDTSSPGTYMVTYTVNDASNNTSSIARTITINPDTTVPVITLNGQSSISLTVGDTYTEQGATANDNVDGNLTNNIVINGSVDTSSPGTYTVTYTVNDASNNTSLIARTITVQDSTANTSQAFTINVSANNASNYILNGTDRNGQVSGNDPTVTIKVGDTVNFAVNAPGHPFYLKTVQGTGTANTISGVTNNGTTNGTVSWIPTQTGTYYYICSLHGGMIGTISVN